MVKKLMAEEKQNNPSSHLDLSDSLIRKIIDVIDANNSGVLSFRSTGCGIKEVWKRRRATTLSMKAEGRGNGCPVAWWRNVPRQHQFLSS